MLPSPVCVASSQPPAAQALSISPESGAAMAAGSGWLARQRLGMGLGTIMLCHRTPDGERAEICSGSSAVIWQQQRSRAGSISASGISGWVSRLPSNSRTALSSVRSAAMQRVQRWQLGLAGQQDGADVYPIGTSQQQQHFAAQFARGSKLFSRVRGLYDGHHAKQGVGERGQHPSTKASHLHRRV